MNNIAEYLTYNLFEPGWAFYISKRPNSGMDLDRQKCYFLLKKNYQR